MCEGENENAVKVEPEGGETRPRQSLNGRMRKKSLWVVVAWGVVTPGATSGGFGDKSTTAVSSAGRVLHDVWAASLLPPVGVR